MTADERNILAEYDRAQSPIWAPPPDSPAAAIAAEMARRGWLRAASPAGAYARTEPGRLQLAQPRDITLYSRPGCHLCEEAKSEIAPLLAEFGATLTEINIDGDPALRAQYDYEVPVIFLGSRKVAKYRVDREQFRRQLRDAS